jgi:large subunit ribosomal protein L17
MRHQIDVKHFGRTSAHRQAMRRNLTASLFEHGTISTTREKAKFVKPFAEKIITLAKQGTLHARRQAIALLQDRDICKVEDGVPVKVNTVIRKLFSEIAPRFAERNGGYTRIIRLPLRRVGDNSRLVLLQLMGETKAPAAEPSHGKKSAEVKSGDKTTADAQAQT